MSTVEAFGIGMRTGVGVAPDARGVSAPGVPGLWLVLSVPDLLLLQPASGHAGAVGAGGRHERGELKAVCRVTEQGGLLVQSAVRCRYRGATLGATSELVIARVAHATREKLENSVFGAREYVDRIPIHSIQSAAH